MLEEKEKRNIIDFRAVVNTLWSKRKVFYKVWAVTFILSCVWIFPQPRYYDCEVSIVPESSDTKTGGISALASSFGINIGGTSESDAIYPQLYPDLFESNQFMIEIFDIKVSSIDGELSTDYYNYRKNHQKKNIFTQPFKDLRKWIISKFKESQKSIPGKDGKRFDPFRLSFDDNRMMKDIQKDITCSYSQTTGVITIKVRDQDPLISATMADSLKAKLQDYIIEYRTQKARLDMEYYESMLVEAEKDCQKAMDIFADYYDQHKHTTQQNYLSQRDKLQNEVSLHRNTYNTMKAQYEAAKAKVQERTPAFTTLKTSTVPVKPAGPKRMIFVGVMLVLSTIVTIGWQFRKELVQWF